MHFATAILITAAQGILMPPPTGGRRPSILSMPYGELTAMAGGPDGAKCVWSLLRAGREPHLAWEDDPAAIAAANAAGLSQARRVAVASACSDSLAAMVPIERTVAADGTTKLLLQLADGLSVETVLIPPLPETAGKRAKSARAHTTVCISSQVGCRQACTFCATGKMGLRRNLDVSEILGQVYAAKREAAAAGLPPLANAVFMGMGEPADNAAAVRQAVACLTDGKRFGLGRSRVLVSTVAPTPQAFATLLRPPDEAADEAADEGAAEGMGEGAGAGEDLGPQLAWSLHAADSGLRRQLVPSSRHSAEELREGLCAALRARPVKRRRIMIEYACIQGVNCEEGHAEDLASFLRPVEAACYDPDRRSRRTGVLVNLIPFNPHPAAPAHFRRPARAEVEAFQARLRTHGIWASIRPARGDDGAAACGQLATSAAAAAAPEGAAAGADTVHAATRRLRGGAASTAGQYVRPPPGWRHMAACEACAGAGQLPAKRSRRRQLARRHAAAAAAPAGVTAPQGVGPPRQRVPCAVCAGVGLQPASRPPAARRDELPAVAVIGGGIGGAALALALQHRGVAVRVYARDPSSPNPDLNPNPYTLTSP